MPVLFVSHSSKDDAAASALEAWLRRNGFTDIFVDHHSIAGGDAWRLALQQAAGTCRVVVCLVTENWLASKDCLAEFDASFYMGKRIIPLFLLPARPAPGTEAGNRHAQVCAHYQGIDVLPCLGPDGALDLAKDRDIADRLKAGLRAGGALAEIGLDPEAFAVDRKLRAMPFPGLASFGDDDADAALFYGRSREIAEALEALRQMRAAAERRPFVILGASGAGKSSLLKAGIVPRLRREAPAWLPLRAFRPGADPLLNFAESLARTLADFGKAEAHGDIRDRLRDAWRKAARGPSGLTPAGHGALQAALEAEGARLRAAAGRAATASILVSIDQAEELARADGDSGDALADYLRVALAAATSWHIALTIRTDSFAELQSHRRFQDIEAHPFDLRAIPVIRFESVIEKPAKRYGVAVDHALVDAVTEDSPKEDALPLLAFALQRLWRQYAASGALTIKHYRNVGGLKGLIEDAAERALRGLAPDEDVSLPATPPPKRRADLAASTFVPALAQINDQGAVIRRIAAWTGFDEEQRDLLERFDHWRLVVRKGGADGGTVEVAHEALFREWARLRGWLKPERARLEALRLLQIDALTWDRNSRDAAYLNHGDKRLAEADARTLPQALGHGGVRLSCGLPGGGALGAKADVAHESGHRRAGLWRRRGSGWLVERNLPAGTHELVRDHAPLYARPRPALRARA
jgi:conflict system STAND superfamily ATPase/TIR domain-containing protein